MPTIGDKIGNALDIAVAIVSPKRGLYRHNLRKALQAQRSGKYAAAKNTKSTGAWSPVDSNVNLIINASSSAVRARVRQLIRDFPYFARAANVMVDYVVGEGIQFQSRVKTRNGDLDTKKISEIEDAFKFWADEADLSGKLHFYELMRLAKRQELEPGEFIFVKQFNTKDKTRFTPYCLQAVEGDALTSYGTERLGAKGKTEIDNGIEFDTATLETVAFHFTDPDGFGKTVSVPADRVIHGFDVMRPDQRRGISPFAPGVLLADDLSTMMDSEIDSAKMASKWLAIVKTMDPASRQLGVGTGTKGEPIEELENAIIEYLRPGEDIELSSNPRPGKNFVPFIRLVTCMFSVTTGAPYELVSGDYQGLNYSVSKAVRNDFKKTLRPMWSRHIRQFCTKAVSPFFKSSFFSGKLDLPGFLNKPERWLAAEWQPPGFESIDDLKDAKANSDDLANRLKSPQEIIKARGRDPEEVIKETAAFNELCKKHGVEPQAVSTALANNPAAVMEQKGDMQEMLMRIMDAVDELSERV